MADLHVYGAGDGSSAELHGMLAKAGFAVEFRDIRGQTGSRHREYLLTRGLQHIPQVFGQDGRHLGDYGTALEELGLCA